VDVLLHPVHIFSCFVCKCTSWVFSTVSRRQAFLSLANRSKHCVLPLFFSLKRAFNISKVSVALLPQYKACLMQTPYSVESAISWVCRNHKWNNSHLYSTRHGSRTTYGSLYSICTQQQKFMLTAVVSPQSVWKVLRLNLVHGDTY
jgi:hypothetical protein